MSQTLNFTTGNDERNNLIANKMRCSHKELFDPKVSHSMEGQIASLNISVSQYNDLNYSAIERHHTISD